MTAKTCSVLVTEVLQVVLLTAIAFALGWSPHGNPLAVLLLLVLGTAAFSGLGLLMAGHAQGGGDARRRQPGLPAAAGRRRGDRAAGQVPGRGAARAGAAADRGAVGRPAGRAPARRRRCRGATSGSSRSGRCWGWARRRASSAGSDADGRAPARRSGVTRPPRESLHKRAAYDGARAEADPSRSRSAVRNPLACIAERWTPSPRTVRRAALAARRDGRGHRGDRRRGPADRLRPGLPDLAQVHRRQPDRDQRDGLPRRHRVRQPDADVRAVRGGRLGDHRRALREAVAARPDPARLGAVLGGHGQRGARRHRRARRPQPVHRRGALPARPPRCSRSPC